MKGIDIVPCTTAGRIRSAPEAPANASVIGRLALAILRMPALATSAGAIHRVPVAAPDRLPAAHGRDRRVAGHKAGLFRDHLAYSPTEGAAHRASPTRANGPS